jgi:hypothetical protein
MKVDKISISLEAELAGRVRAAAIRRDTAVSSWLAEAALARLRNEALAEFLDTWEGSHGPLTLEELRRAETSLGLKKRKSKR